MSMIKYNSCFSIPMHLSKLKSGLHTILLCILCFLIHIFFFLLLGWKNPQNFICSLSVLFSFYSIFLSSALNFPEPCRAHSIMQLATSAQCNFLDFLLKISFHCWGPLCYWFSSAFSIIFLCVFAFAILLFPSAIEIPGCHCNWLWFKSYQRKERKAAKILKKYLNHFLFGIHI